MSGLFQTEMEKFIKDRTDNLSCDYFTKSYIEGLFLDLGRPDYSKDSITLIFAQAKFEQRFELFQSLADWIFFVGSLYGRTDRYQETIAQVSYYRCYQILNKQWKLYEELADRCPILINQMQKNLSLHF